jgi:hypothetical protein
MKNQGKQSLPKVHNFPLMEANETEILEMKRLITQIKT